MFKPLLVLMVLLPLICSASDDVSGKNHDDIRGYNYKQYRWLLGDRIANVDTDNFTVSYNDEMQMDAYADFYCELAFGGTKVESPVVLWVHEGIIKGIQIVVGSKQMSPARLRRYYDNLRSGCELVKDEWDSVVWNDADGDAMVLAPFVNDYGESHGTIVQYYYRGGRPPEPDMPSWLHEAMGY